MAERLTPLTSRIDALKRQLYDALTNPKDYLSMVGGRAAESLYATQQLQKQAFGDPRDPFKVTNENALRQLTDALMSGPMGFAPAGITAYHGSPYLFKQFDPMKVGTGEGAQAYGVGAGYTAEARPVAEGYRQAVKDMGTIRDINAQMAALSKIMDEDSVYPGAYRKFKSDRGRQAAEQYDRLIAKRDEVRTAPGYLYKGDIPDEIIPSFIDWDKPVSQQKDVMRMLKEGAEARVRERLLLEMQAKVAAEMPRQSASSGDFLDVLFSEGNKVATEKARQVAQERLSKMDISSLVNKELDSLKPKDSNWKLTGKELYEYLAKTSGGQDKATQLLNESGIRGIRYLDQTSRGQGKGTSNFVPFRPEDFKIQEINDRPLEEYIAQGLLAP